MVEGRTIYDCFVLNEKSAAIFYQGGAKVLRTMQLMTAATAANKSTIILMNPTTKAAATNKWYYVTAATAAGLTAVTFGTAITPAAWTELTSSSVEFTPTSGHKYVRVVEVGSDNKPIGMGDALLNIG